ncbi:hypothetical protein F442_21587 [Phytophthora nicotianae P10297]|uniref:Uncharacterized protein n=1 Tax=Phytophthora nicotianae P10297 TaxID=1317064 RepID=W2Y4Y6_PHYNI|nr:hypothetical protein F442_21587 [Phytophthora nicotianae P10297]
MTATTVITAVLALQLELLTLGLLLDKTHMEIVQQHNVLIAKLRRLVRGFRLLQHEIEVNDDNAERRRRGERSYELLNDQFIETKADIARVCLRRRQFENQMLLILMIS